MTIEDVRFDIYLSCIYLSFIWIKLHIIVSYFIIQWQISIELIWKILLISYYCNIDFTWFYGDQTKMKSLLRRFKNIDMISENLYGNNIKP